MLTGNWAALYDEIAAMREACGAAHMKAILATGDLKTLRNVYAASMVAMKAGADFIKTSTGKEGVNATLPVSLVMVRAIRDYGEATGYRVGFKPAGGMRTAKDAMAWQILMKEELGRDWLRAGSVPLRRLLAAGRHRAPARAFRHRPLFGLQPPRASPEGAQAHERDHATFSKTMDYGPAPEDAGIVGRLARHARRGLRPFHRRRVHHASGKTFDSAQSGDRRRSLPRSTQGRRPMSMPPCGRPRAAHAGWAALSGHERARHLYALARHVQKHARLLAVLETLDNGKPIRETPRHRRSAGRAPFLSPRRLGRDRWTTSFPAIVPVGVCGQVIPWNFPLLMLAWKVAPALAAGNTVVLKPAEYTPLTAMAFAEICAEAGLPRGVFNIVTGDGETGARDHRP